MAARETSFERVRLFIPGVPASSKQVNAALRSMKAKVDVEWVENDGHFGKAFSFGTVDPAGVAAIDAVPGALVVCSHVDLREGRTEIVALVERLRDAGALAVRVEQSKLGWDVARWIELFTSDYPGDWHQGAVTFLVGDDAVQSCGMHAFSLPDVHLALDGDSDGDAGALQRLGTTLNVYQLAEDPALLSGHTFRPDDETPRRVLDRWPDAEYPRGHACHNPYGVWRLGPPGGAARDVGALAPTFVPSLAAVLTALERENGKPLTRKQVEAARDDGACIAMTVRDVQMLERSRGYADLDPAFAWEQWQLVRRG